MISIGTTKRERLTPRQLLKLFEDENGRCCICKLPIAVGKKWIDTLKGEKGFIDEHKRALGLGGSNKLSNRGVAHIHCAEVKTREDDMPRITKAKAQKRAFLGIAKSAHTKKIPSREFPKSGKPKREREPRAQLPRKALYV